MKKLITIAFCILTFHSYADSPLTSTFFAMAYNDVPMIGSIMQRRMNEGISNLTLTKEHMDFLDNAMISLDQKVALINGLGWGDPANTELFINHLMKKYNLTHDVLDSTLVPRDSDLTSGLWPAAHVISSNDLAMLSYIQAMGNYFEPEKGWNAIYHAMETNPGSEATAYVAGLVAAQLYMDVDWCNVYLVMVEVQAQTYEKDFMRTAAVSTIMEYINLYAESCTVEGEEDYEEYAFIPREDWTPDYWLSNACYPKPAAQQKSDKTNSVDLKLLNEIPSGGMMYEDWVIYDDETHGTRIKVSIKNTGNTKSIATNIALLVKDSSEEFPYIMVQKEIPGIPGGAKIEIDIILEDYWIYDPDASFEIILDYDNNIEEADEKNNKKWFSENG